MIKTENFDSYVAHTAINASLLKRLSKSPQTAYATKTETSAAMDFGHAYHTYILEPEQFDSLYVLYDAAKRPEADKNFGSKANKEWRNAIYKQAVVDRKTVVEVSDMEKIKLMAAQLKQNSIYAERLIANTTHEQSVYQSVEIAGQQYDVKCRIDGINSEHGVIFDLKTSKDAHPSGFQREAGQFQYHLQMAFYKRLAELEFGKPFEVFIIAQETEAPFNSGMYRITPAMISKGNIEVENMLKLAAHIHRTGEIGSYEVFTNNQYGILDLDIPNYYVNDCDLNI